ncbi:homoserine O-acetyltransferase MetA [Pseudobacillus badius]|uniref:homoserine O-acetyltransferase MetA n=1 Tax=Bacillus badius TaxID=1455 RepID=UPI0007B08DE9|nr:homoserine O-succinyltransferase [Bacillus badius]KZN98146.1 homoserine O-succinyltransferase [Bacillus badius]MED0665413.1 homoserine O-succinyltransferase [Bacillus badius]OCS82409.1 homoserine O-succinyltransferase [Bacillus badius]OVE50945.1 homoserine O-succinyltransferase [Bacillus badius]TDW01749.1 homoserine O-succinyltransferase [Bacillus badius]
MPINIPQQLPAREILEKENIFVMDVDRARRQDIRPLNILILNLMPEKEKTEAQLLRLLGNTPLQVNVSFLYTATYESRNVSKSHLQQFYTTFEEVKGRRIDGMIITGAPIELMEFEEVSYWEELTEIMDWAKTNVTSLLHICWGAQAALYHYFGIGKFELPKKCSGVFSHTVNEPTVKLMRGFDDLFYAPHSRYTDVEIEKIKDHNDLQLLAYSEEAGAFIIMSKDERHIMITGHLEYEAHTLSEEYARDLAKGLDIDMPKNYFPDNNPTKKPINKWRSHAHLLFSNWLNYYVYQETPYEWD